MFLIGEFSRIARVSSRLLRYYDQLGLLRPEHVDQATGYRYYRASQLPQLNRILVLKEIGFTLDEIARVVARPIAAAELREMLVDRRADIARQIEREEERLRHVEARIAQIDDAGQLTEDDVVVRAEPERLLLAIRVPATSFAAAVAVLGDVVRSARRAVPKSELGPLIVVSHGDAFDPDLLDLEIGHIVTGQTAPVALAGGGASR